jgi:hypothetical protein
MPGKNKPKRLDRNRAWRVARRKRKVSKLVSGGSRNRAPRAKKKKAAEVKVEKVVKVEKKVVKKIVKKAVKKK